MEVFFPFFKKMKLNIGIIIMCGVVWEIGKPYVQVFVFNSFQSIGFLNFV